MIDELTNEERHAVLYSVRSSIDLYKRHRSVFCYDAKDKRKKARIEARLKLLLAALPKLRTKSER